VSCPLRVGTYISNRGKKRRHLAVAGCEHSLCGLHFIAFAPVQFIEPSVATTVPTAGLRARDADVESLLMWFQGPDDRPHCRRCLRLAQRFRDPITQLGDLV